MYAFNEMGIPKKERHTKFTIGMVRICRKPNKPKINTNKDIQIHTDTYRYIQTQTLNDIPICFKIRL